VLLPAAAMLEAAAAPCGAFLQDDQSVYVALTDASIPAPAVLALGPIGLSVLHVDADLLSSHIRLQSVSVHTSTAAQQIAVHLTCVVSRGLILGAANRLGDGPGIQNAVRKASRLTSAICKASSQREGAAGGNIASPAKQAEYAFPAFLDNAFQVR
jgi:hypothetical protein